MLPKKRGLRVVLDIKIFSTENDMAKSAATFFTIGFPPRFVTKTAEKKSIGLLFCCVGVYFERKRGMAAKHVFYRFAFCLVCF